MPEAGGFLYNLVGDGYEMDATWRHRPLSTAPVPTWCRHQVRPAVCRSSSARSPSCCTTWDILLGFVYTDRPSVLGHQYPTVAVMSGFEKNPQMIVGSGHLPDILAWPISAPLVPRFATSAAAYMDYPPPPASSADQVDGSYTGDPSLFVTDEGKSAQQGFGSADPYLYKNELKDWGKDVKYQYINDVGWRNYAESIATKPENITKYSDCFKKLVPIIQQASADYVNSPARTNAIILDASAQFGADFGWTYTQGAADYGVATIKADGLVANGSDGVMGSFDMARVNDLIEKATPVYTAQDSPPKDGLKAEDIVTNQFLDTSIKL